MCAVCVNLFLCVCMCVGVYAGVRGETHSLYYDDGHTESG